MPWKPKSACPVCRRVGCTAHKRSRSRPETRQEREAKVKLVKEWVEAHGYWCPGFEVEPHPSADLTADHILPVGLGGDVLGPMQVLCRKCNSRRGNKLRMGG